VVLESVLAKVGTSIRAGGGILDSAVRALQQISGQLANGRRFRAWMALDRHQKLVLNGG